MTQTEVERFAELAREHGRLGLDTEFMPEGRYRPLLCLVQIVVGERGRGARSARRPSTRRRSPRCSPIRRSRSCCTPAARTWRSCGASGRRRSRNVFDTQVAAGFAGFSAQAGYNGLLHDVLRIRLPKTASLHALGRAPADRGAARLRARRRRAPAARWPTTSRRGWSTAAGSDWAREECVAIAEATDERDPDGGVAAAAAGQRARSARARGGARARRVARAHGGARGPAGRRDPARPDGRRAGQAPAGRAGASCRRSAASRPTWCAAAARTSCRRSSAASGPSRSGWRRATARRPRRSTARRSRWPSRSCASRAQEAGLAYELIAARADLAPVVVAARRGGAEPDGADAAGLAPRAGRRRAARAARRAAHGSASGRAAGSRSARTEPE